MNTGILCLKHKINLDISVIGMWEARVWGGSRASCGDLHLHPYKPNQGLEQTYP